MGYSPHIDVLGYTISSCHFGARLTHHPYPEPFFLHPVSIIWGLVKKIRG
jgi:hypothetical protein